MAKYTKCLNDKTCFLSGRTDNLEVHHIFGGSMREKSELYGMKIWLNHDWHNEPPNGVHFNKDNMLTVKKYGQTKFNEIYKDLNFFDIFKNNYL